MRTQTEQEKFHEGISSWNSSESTLRRIHEIQLRIDMYREINTWQSLGMTRDSLESLHMELIGYMSTDECILGEKFRIRYLPSHYGTKHLSKTPPPVIKENLRAWEIFLRGIVVKKGMGLIAKDTDAVFILPGGRK